MRVIFIVLCFISTVFALEKTDDLELKYNELKVLKLFLDNVRDSLDIETQKRWEAKERYIEQKKLDKEELTNLSDKLEKRYNEMSRIKEEILMYENRLSDQQKIVDKLKKEKEFYSLNIKDQFETINKSIYGHFPLDIENEKLLVNKLSREFSTNKNIKLSLNKVRQFYVNRFAKYNKITLSRQMILADNSKSGEEMSLLRFGEVGGYALNNNGELFIIRETGNISSKYAIDKIGDLELKDKVQKIVVETQNSGVLDGLVPFETLQNASSKKLIAGEKVSKFEKLYNWFNKGGAVMWALLLIVGWTIILIIEKIIQFSSKQKNAKKLRKNIITIMEKDGKESAIEYLQDKKGVIAKAALVCLTHSKWNRESAEKAVKEVLIEEMPIISKGLTTLAVLASSAPMLGLLGTVTGMIHLFKVITQYGTSDPSILAGGISEALITTQAGLIVAIPLLLVHNYLKNRASFLQTEIERNSIKILNRLWPEG